MGISELIQRSKLKIEIMELLDRTPCAPVGVLSELIEEFKLETNVSPVLPKLENVMSSLAKEEIKSVALVSELEDGSIINASSGKTLNHGDVLIQVPAKTRVRNGKTFHVKAHSLIKRASSKPFVGRTNGPAATWRGRISHKLASGKKLSLEELRDELDVDGAKDSSCLSTALYDMKCDGLLVHVDGKWSMKP